MADRKSAAMRWLKLALAFIGFLIISVALGYFIRYFLDRYHIPPGVPVWLAAVIVFGLLLVVNLSVLPLPFGISIMLAATAQWNPLLIALVGSLGASLGEFSGYFFGYLGKKISIDENTPGYEMVHNWILRYGMWAIALLSFQPLIPFEIGGFIAGVVKMPVKRFMPAIWIGKFPKYIILIYLGNTIMNHIPFLH